MKNKLLSILLILTIFLITGCDNNSSKTMTCRRILNQDNIKTELLYVVTYENNYVTRVKSNESIESDNATLLDTYKSSVETVFYPYKDVEYYNYEVKIEGNKLISTTDIDYTKVNTDRLIEIDPENNSLIKNGKINISDIKSVYEELGATCE